MEALSARSTRPAAVQKAVVVHYGICVLNGDGSVVCWPGSRKPWTLPGIQASDIAASTEQTSHGTAFCVNAIGQGVRCYRARGPEPEFMGQADVELESLTVNDLEVCGLSRGVPRCFHVPGQKRGKGVLKEGAPWDGFDASSPAAAISSNRQLDVCALRGSHVTCREGGSPPLGYQVEKTLPAPAVAIAVGRKVTCVVLEGKTSIACFHPRSSPEQEEIEVDPLHEGSGTIEGAVGTEDGMCFLRTGGLICLGQQRLYFPPSEPPVAAVAAAEPAKPLPPPKPSGGAPREDPDLTFYAALPFSFGHGYYTSRSGSGSGLWLRLRGVIAVGREGTFRRRGWALGPYFEVGWHPVTGEDRMASFGAGATAIWSVTRTLGVMPSLGWYSQNYPGGKNEHGLSAGVFVGLMQDSFGPLFFPIGVRIEARMGLGDQHERSTLFGGEVDAIIGAAAPVFIVLLLRSS